MFSWVLTNIQRVDCDLQKVGYTGILDTPTLVKSSTSKKYRPENLWLLLPVFRRNSNQEKNKYLQIFQIQLYFNYVYFPCSSNKLPECNSVSAIIRGGIVLIKLKWWLGASLPSLCSSPPKTRTDKKPNANRRREYFVSIFSQISSPNSIKHIHHSTAGCSMGKNEQK